MARNHGACPHCQESMQGEEIDGLPGRFHDLKIPVVIDEVSPEALFWRCPFCGQRWPRATSGPLLAKALAVEATWRVQQAHEARQDAAKLGPL